MPSTQNKRSERINISRYYFKGGGKLLLNISCARVRVVCIPLWLQRCRKSASGGLGGGGLGGVWAETRPVGADLGFWRESGNTVLRYVSVRGDSTIKSNYTTITGSLIRLRATGVIHPCDHAERAHSSLHRLDIIQSVLQRHTANWGCCCVCCSVSQLKSSLWLQLQATPSNYSMMFPTVCYLIKGKWFWMELNQTVQF